MTTRRRAQHLDLQEDRRREESQLGSLASGRDTSGSPSFPTLGLVLRDPSRGCAWVARYPQCQRSSHGMMRLRSAMRVRQRNITSSSFALNATVGLQWPHRNSSFWFSFIDANKWSRLSQTWPVGARLAICCSRSVIILFGTSLQAGYVWAPFWLPLLWSILVGAGCPAVF
jgi:hypothetical protein